MTIIVKRAVYNGSKFSYDTYLYTVEYNELCQKLEKMFDYLFLQVQQISGIHKYAEKPSGTKHWTPIACHHDMLFLFNRGKTVQFWYEYRNMSERRVVQVVELE